MTIHANHIDETAQRMITPLGIVNKLQTVGKHFWNMHGYH